MTCTLALAFGTECQMRVDFAVHVLAQNGLRQQIHLAAMSGSARNVGNGSRRPRAPPAGAGGDRDHGAVPARTDGTLRGIRAEHESPSPVRAVISA